MQTDIREIRNGLNDYVYIGTVIFLLLALLFIFFLMISLRRRRKMNLEKTELQEHFREELLRTQLEIQEQTFKTISQEIHDNIGQMLSLAKLNLATIDLRKEEKAVVKIEDAKDLVGKAIQDLRDLSKTLNTESIAATGLLKAIEAELHLLQKTGTLQTTFDISGTPVRLDAQKELILFRIVQEALHNIIKHAQAANVRVNAVFEHGRFKLLIADDGCGFEESAESIAAGSGLGNMQSRSALIGAGWQLESKKGQGTSVRITLPITA